MFDLTAILFLAEGGFDPFKPTFVGSALWTWIIFLGALLPIWKMVMGPITSALLERDELAKRAITQAEKASADAEAARAEVEVKLGEARNLAQQIVNEARERGDAQKREIVESAKAEAHNLIESARAQIKAEQDKALATIRAEVVDLSLDAATKVLGRNVGSDDDRRLVQELVGSGGGQGA
ncbi:MAG: F0F1 ATP synthase subunit B [Planctomycetota bacterium]|jgi:F-type H+-transporting ATPase subunit b